MCSYFTGGKAGVKLLLEKLGATAEESKSKVRDLILPFEFGNPPFNPSDITND